MWKNIIVLLKSTKFILKWSLWVWLHEIPHQNKFVKFNISNFRGKLKYFCKNHLGWGWNYGAKFFCPKIRGYSPNWHHCANRIKTNEFCLPQKIIGGVWQSEILTRARILYDLKAFFRLSDAALKTKKQIVPPIFKVPIFLSFVMRLETRKTIESDFWSNLIFDRNKLSK